MNDKNKERAKIAKANMRREAARSASVAYFAAPATNAALGFPSACPSTSPMPFRCHSPPPPPFWLTFLTCRELEKQQINILGTLKYVCVPRVCVFVCVLCELKLKLRLSLCFLSVFWFIF